MYLVSGNVLASNTSTMYTSLLTCPSPSPLTVVTQEMWASAIGPDSGVPIWLGQQAKLKLLMGGGTIKCDGDLVSDDYGTSLPGLHKGSSESCPVST